MGHLPADEMNEDVAARAADACAARGIRLPTFGELADPGSIDADVVERLKDVDPDAADPLNLFRVHWFNDASRRGRVDVPEHVVLPPALTGCDSPVVVLLGNRFPMIGAHKVLAAYACLAPRVVTGEFDPESQRALWPSTGNYCRGGVAISRIMGARGVAILPEGMSRERFDWLDRWVADPTDIVRTPGTESNVREIYETCERLAADPTHVVFNQFSEFANHIAHRMITGHAMEVVAEHLMAGGAGRNVAAFCSATGSAGTIAAGNHLKEKYGTKISAAEALECPTMLECGFGEHNIQGIGDKHIPFIHDALNTDVVVAVSDRSSDAMFCLLQEKTGRDLVGALDGVDDAIVGAVGDFGLSGWCNVLAAARTARDLGLGPDDLVLTIATDGAAMYGTEHEKIINRDFSGEIDGPKAAATFEHHVRMGGDTESEVLDDRGRNRIFNLGYFTWVEQRGVSLEEFVARRERSFWNDLMKFPVKWDEQIREFNRRAGV